jgi:hypothetical protein
VVEQSLAVVRSSARHSHLVAKPAVQVQYEFISLEFLSAIHARDIALSRTQGYLPEQLYVSTNPPTIPLWANGLRFYVVSPARVERRLGCPNALPHQRKALSRDHCLIEHVTVDKPIDSKHGRRYRLLGWPELVQTLAGIYAVLPG